MRTSRKRKKRYHAFWRGVNRETMRELRGIKSFCGTKRGVINRLKKASKSYKVVGLAIYPMDKIVTNWDDPVWLDNKGSLFDVDDLIEALSWL